MAPQLVQPPLATGAGADNRQLIGWVIVGGMSLGTLSTLFVVPGVYTLMGRRLAKPEDISANAVPATATAPAE